MTEFSTTDLKKRMNGAVEVLRKEFGGLRTGRASASLLEPMVIRPDSARSANRLAAMPRS